MPATQPHHTRQAGGAHASQAHRARDDRCAAGAQRYSRLERECWVQYTHGAHETAGVTAESDARRAAPPLKKKRVIQSSGPAAASVTRDTWQSHPAWEPAAVVVVRGRPLKQGGCVRMRGAGGETRCAGQARGRHAEKTLRRSFVHTK